MSDRNLLVGPFNRVEGDLEVRLKIQDGQVESAYVNSPLFRGFEAMLLGKAPQDALTITPRICGICSISQSAAAAQALASVARAEPTPQGALVAGLLHGIENLCDHLTHFNLFFMPDFARPFYADHSWHSRAVARFTAMQGSAIRQATEARAQLLHVIGLLGGKWPHTLAIQPGGVTRAPTARDRIRITSVLGAFRRYLEDVMFGAPLEDFVGLEQTDQVMSWSTGDVGLFIDVAVALELASSGRGPGRYMSFGAYPQADGRCFGPGVWEDGQIRALNAADIREDLSHAWMLGANAHPANGQTEPDEEMTDPGYSWCKAPRLNGQTIETGAFARQVVDKHPLALDLAASGGGVFARVIGRLLEIARTQILLEAWANAITPEARFLEQISLPNKGSGEGLVEAARGALGHWISVDEGRISSYQIIAPTTWNFSPRDSSGQPGPLEAALVGAPVKDGEDTPLAVQHIVRSFDPCMVCTVH